MFPLLAALAAGVGKIGTDIYQNTRASRYQRRANAQNKANEDKAALDARMAAMRRSLGVDIDVNNQPLNPIDAPPDLSGSSTLGGLFEFGGNLAAAGAMQRQLPKPWKPTPGRTYI